MDGTTEPIIAVIGHPIAGNPSQLAIERALARLGLEWRVLSFDVAPDDVAKALDGFSVTGIRGVLIDPSVQEQASTWYADYQSDDDSVTFDCLYRDSDQKFVGTFERKQWIESLIESRGVENTRWIGEWPSQPNSPSTVVDPVKLDASGGSMPPEPESIADADLIVLSPPTQDTATGESLETEEWPENDGTTLVIDLTDGHPDAARIAKLGYPFVSELEIQAGTLQRCLHRWTAGTASSETGLESSAETLTDTITEAIEEYLGV